MIFNLKSNQLNLVKSYGVVMSGRRGDIANSDVVVGNCINTIPFRMNMENSKNILQLAKHLQNLQTEIVSHSHVSLSQIKEWIGASSNTSLFDIIFVYESNNVHELTVS